MREVGSLCFLYVSVPIPSWSRKLIPLNSRSPVLTLSTFQRTHVMLILGAGSVLGVHPLIRLLIWGHDLPPPDCVTSIWDQSHPYCPSCHPPCCRTAQWWMKEGNPPWLSSINNLPTDIYHTYGHKHVAIHGKWRWKQTALLKLMGFQEERLCQRRTGMLQANAVRDAEAHDPLIKCLSRWVSEFWMCQVFREVSSLYVMYFIISPLRSRMSPIVSHLHSSAAELRRRKVK